MTEKFCCCQPDKPVEDRIMKLPAFFEAMDMKMIASEKFLV